MAISKIDTKRENIDGDGGQVKFGTAGLYLDLSDKKLFSERL